MVKITPKLVSSLLRRKSDHYMLSYSIAERTIRYKKDSPVDLMEEVNNLFNDILDNPQRYLVNKDKAIEALRRNKSFSGWFYSLEIPYQILLEEELSNNDNFWERNIVKRIIEVNRPNAVN